MRIEFTHWDAAGVIDAAVVPNTDPASVGCDDDNLGLPVCTATIRYDGNGYRAMFGWVQLVRSTEVAADFETDPYFLFPDADSPYPFYGHKPTLFDAPGRAHRDDMAWMAHSFLAVTPIRSGARLVTPVQGFSWGFTIRSRVVEMVAVHPLSTSDWNAHLPHLARRYPSWDFAARDTWT